MRLRVKAEILQNALHNLVEIEGITREEIMESSKTHNLSRTMSGETLATANTWEKLHKAYPKDIPSVVWTDGRVDFRQTVGDGNTNTTIVGHGSTSGVQLSPKEQTIVTLLREKDKDGSLANRILSILLQD